MQEFEKMKEIAPDNFRLDFAVSREQTNAKGEKMYIQTRIGESAEEFWQLLKKESTFVYMCGLKGMEKGIDDVISSLAERDGIDYRHFPRRLHSQSQSLDIVFFQDFGRSTSNNFNGGTSKNLIWLWQNWRKLILAKLECVLIHPGCDGRSCLGRLQEGSQEE